MIERMPVIFFGHGNPINAVQDTVWSATWAALGQQLVRPRAVLSVSAHWYVRGTAVTAMARPRTLHDFGGFPQELFEVEYPAPGSAALATRVKELLRPTTVRPDQSWGLDHGTWSVLRHVFPDADVPVVQLSIDATQPAKFHYELGRRLAPLRDDGILVLGSGNVVHNLQAYAWNRAAVRPLDWATRFEKTVRDLIQQEEHELLVDYAALGPDAERSIPTPEHYLPLLYVLGASERGDTVSFLTDGIEGGSLSMLSVRLG